MDTKSYRDGPHIQIPRVSAEVVLIVHVQQLDRLFFLTAGNHQPCRFQAYAVKILTFDYGKSMFEFESSSFEHSGFVSGA